MEIFVDSHIVLADELFANLGTITRYEPHSLSAQDIKNADILLTRSTVKVNEKLLHQSSVKFVGSCVIGKDHLDIDYLESQQIAWSNAPSCNAQAVIQYVLSVMARLQPDWMQRSVGIIACGSIGSQVLQRLRAIGVACMCYDPFVSSKDVTGLVSLDSVLQADIIISHAPLTTGGSHPTFHMLDRAALEKIRPESLLISAGRGAVVDNQALLACLKQQKSFSVALDVWEPEPDINEELLSLVDIGTPHIAGHSLEGKENGTAIIYRKCCQALGVEPTVDVGAVLTSDTAYMDVIAKSGESDQDMLNRIILATYDVARDSCALQQWSASGRSLQQHFLQLRKQYPLRREFSHYRYGSLEQRPKVKQWLELFQRGGMFR